MSRLVISPEEIAVRLFIAPPLGAKVADWAAYRGRVAKRPPAPVSVEYRDMRKAKPKAKPRAVEAKAEPVLFVPFVMPPPMGEPDYEPPILTRQPPKIRDIVAACCAEYGLTRAEILSPSHCKRVVEPRHVAFYLCKRLTLRSYPDIAKHMNRQDHTTALSGARRTERRLLTDALFRDRVEKIERAIVGAGVELSP